ncbi:YciI family protein [Nocardioides sp. T2.26MG-1]|uniref:YciI family protein n=1 Tax=Nocardioides sp. T2.26MG-1 TaxID=3041166 RepID=UPI002477C5EC|nr:YciI family protein [Nocardioides sp. T2.26MG-1]CAI9419379.1 hypothetical protein HIDPHFAB_03663 [Nocardioides sp. T2.26MG-1]
MKYLMLVCGDENGDFSGVDLDPTAWVEEMTARGAREDGHRLAPTSTATTVRRRGTEVLVSDGPFAETKEQVGGFDIIEAADLDEAIEIASKHPVARIGTIEIRPFWDQ